MINLIFFSSSSSLFIQLPAHINIEILASSSFKSMMINFEMRGRRRFEQLKLSHFNVVVVDV